MSMSAPQTSVPKHTPYDVRHIPSLDGIRAVSIFIVFLAHCGWDQVIPGGLGVTIFFYLSGYLITTLLRVEFASNGRINLPHFWLRRSLRILPNFYIVLIASYLVSSFYSPLSADTARTFLAQAFHLTNYFIIESGYTGFPVFGGTGVYWSLAVEEHFYLVFPLLFIFLQHRGLSGRKQALVLGLLCLLILAWRLLLIADQGQGFHANRTYMGSDTRIDSILFGCISAVWLNPKLDGDLGPEKLWKFLLLPFGLCLLAFSLVVRSPEFRESLRYTIQGLSLLLIFNAAIRYPHWLAFSWLNTPPVRFLGAISYSFYLVHFTIVGMVRHALPTAPTVAIVLASLALTMLISCALYFGIEKPCTRLRHSFID